MAKFWPILILVIALGWLSQALLGGAFQAPAGQASSGPAAFVADDYYDIGKFHQSATTQSDQAQLWFDRGLAMCFAFNHEEGVRCFERALQADPSMSMALWGIAYALGPNINNMEIDPQQIAQAEFALRQAGLHAEKCTPLELDLIDVLATRYPFPAPPIDEREPVNRVYADVLRELHEKYPEQPLVAALFAESLMILRPWNHWSKDGQPAEETPEIVKVLESSLKLWPDHPAFGHMYIHAMEASPWPERALAAAERLADSMPGAGHLVHMPSHIYVLMGDYERTIVANQMAIEADKEFLKREGPLNFYSLYRLHNYHFLVYGAMFDGQRELALATAREIPAQVPEAMLREQVDFIDAFIPTTLHVMVRFGMWEEILEETEPAEYLPVTRAIWRYARAIAFAATGRVAEAEREQEKFLEAKSAVPETSILFNNTCRDILGVAEAMVAGEVEYRRGNYDQAFEHLREAVRRDDGLNYDEPWGWMQPARHALGALMLEQNRFAEAEAVYREDLKRRPLNAWSLAGLADCLFKQGEAVEANTVRKQLNLVSSRADVAIDRSCFCKNQDEPAAETDR